MADAPSAPGSYVGEHQNGYFWNGTSWDQAETMAGTTTPSTPAPAPTPSASKRPSILHTIMRVESGGRNVPQQIDDINMRNGDPAQGFYQITGGTWREFGGDKAGHKSAIDAPYATQLQVAQNIPVARWGPATQQALKAAGYEAQPGETLGQMLARYNEDPTVTRPEDVGGSSAVADGSAPTQQPYAPPPGLLQSGLLAQSNSADLLAAQQAAAKAKAQDDLYAGLTKTGTGLLGQAETPGAPFLPASAQVHRPQVQAAGMPDFTQILAQQRLMRGV